MDEKRPTREVVWLIDVDDEQPGRGENVLALGLGGKLCETVWGKDSHQFFKAWMPYPKVPPVVRKKLHDLYMNGGFGGYGTQNHTHR